MSPQDPSRAVHAEIRGLLSDRSLRGDALCRSLSDLGARHHLEPFSTVLDDLLGLDLPETRARGTVRLIEEHRDIVAAALGGDRGFEVAAFDYLHEIEGMLREPVFRAGPVGEFPLRAGEAAADVPSGPRAQIEVRRAERGGRPLALVSLAPDAVMGADGAVLTDAVAAVRDAARDTDLASGGEGAFILMLPCTDLEEALCAADRYRRVLADSTGTPWSAGVAAVSPEPETVAGLEARAHGALGVARAAGGDRTAAARADRRAHGRRPCAGEVRGRILEGGTPAAIEVENLSLGGALVATPGPLRPGDRIVLSLRGAMARSREIVLPGRVGRSLGRVGAPASWRSAVAFTADTAARMRVAGLLADLTEAGTLPVSPASGRPTA